MYKEKIADVIKEATFFLCKKIDVMGGVYNLDWANLRYIDVQSNEHCIYEEPVTIVRDSIQFWIQELRIKEVSRRPVMGQLRKETLIVATVTMIGDDGAHVSVGDMCLLDMEIVTLVDGIINFKL